VIMPPGHDEGPGIDNAGRRQGRRRHMTHNGASR
jgi:hypothetical protein